MLFDYVLGSIVTIVIMVYLVYALINLDVVDLLAGEEDAQVRLEHHLQLAKDHGQTEHAGRIYVALVWWAPRDKKLSPRGQVSRRRP